MDKDKTDYLETIGKSGRYSDEVLNIVEKDLSYGLSIEEVQYYHQKKISVDRMQLISKAYREGCSKRLMETIDATKVDVETFLVVMDFARSKVPEDTIVSVIKEGISSEKMRERLKGIHAKMNEAVSGIESKVDAGVGAEDKEYLTKIVDEMKDIVSKIEVQDKRYDALNDKLESMKDGKKIETEKLVSGYEMQVAGPGGKMQKITVDYQPKRKKGVSAIAFAMFGTKKKWKQNIVKLVAESALSSEQLVVIQEGMKLGLNDNQLTLLVNNNLTVDRMREIVKIADLENKLGC